MSNKDPRPTTPVSRRDRAQQKKLKRHKKQTVLALALGGIAVITGFAIGISTYLLKDIPALRLSDFVDLSAASLVYASDGSVLGRFASEGDRRPLTSLQDAGLPLEDAVIAAEDKDFYHHIGIDPLAIVRSAWDDLHHQSIRSGGSTITQQTVKLAMFPNQERTVRRKVQEMVLALELEHRQSKQQILLEYVNALYFGRVHGVPLYGVESAALHIFGRHAKDLSPAQAAFLAAIPNNPTYFSLEQYPEHVLDRQHYILGKMHTLGYLHDGDFLHAMAEPVLQEVRHDRILYAPYESNSPYILAQVSHLAPRLIAQSEGISQSQAQTELESRGYRIYTSIDPSLQQRMEQTIATTRDFPPDLTVVSMGRQRKNKRHVQEQLGMVIIQNTSGRIVALAGGRNFAKSQVDHTLMRRQAGSALKPLVVYGPALEHGIITPGSVVDDIPETYYDPNSPSKQWFPMNWDNQFHGLMTARDALMHSYNLPAISLLNQMGPQIGAHYAWELGLAGIEKSDANSLGLAIGGTRGGVSPEELAAAYSTLARGGLYTEPSLIDRIDDSLGKQVYRHEVRTHRVFHTEVAALLTTMLKQVIESPYGTAHTIARSLHHVDVAGKTGTTDNNKDAWFVGYTPSYTMSTWVGYDFPHALLTTAHYAEPLRPQKLFVRVLGPVITQRREHFALPATIHPYVICTKSGLLASPLCKAAHDTEIDYFAAGTEPTDICHSHQIVFTTVVNGVRVLATEYTPLYEIKTEILFNRPAITLDQKLQKYAPRDITESIPTELDPRGGFPLSDFQPSSTTVTPLSPSP
ncbi:MAG: transglycosylase domain-containing protein [Acidibacillus sp.]|nr:transglycosylase domain-containing protein [Acidibacillus sp.]